MTDPEAQREQSTPEQEDIYPALSLVGEDTAHQIDPEKFATYSSLGIAINKAGVGGYIYSEHDDKNFADQTLIEAGILDGDPTEGRDGKDIVRGAYVDLLCKLDEEGELSKSVDSLLQSMINDASGTAKLIGAFANVAALGEGNDSLPEAPRSLQHKDSADLYSVMQFKKDDRVEAILSKAFQFLDDRGETMNKLVLEQYFVADKPAMSIGGDLGLGEAAINLMIRNTCARIQESTGLDTKILLKRSTQPTASSPQERVMKWITWSHDRDHGVTTNDMRFVLREMTRWNLQTLDEKGTQRSSFKAPVSSFNDTELLPALSELLPRVDDSMSFTQDGDLIRFNIEGEIDPYHIQALALVDYILENNSFKTIQRLQIATKNNPFSGELYEQPAKKEEPVGVEGEMENILAPREFEMFSRIYWANADIAEDISISMTNVGFQISSLVKKTGMPRGELILLSYEMGHLMIDEKTEESINSDSAPLSDEEKNVLALLVEGKDSTEIGETLNMHRNTVTNYTKQVRKKLGVEDTNTAILVAYIKGEIGLPDQVSAYLDAKNDD